MRRPDQAAADLWPHLRAADPGEGERRVCLIAGESGSGKSTLAQVLSEQSEGRARLLHVDDYYRLSPEENRDRRRADPSWCGPMEVDLERLLRDAEAFLGGASRVRCPLWVGPKANEREVSFAGADLLLVEGTWSFRVEVPAVRVFIDRRHGDTLQDRIARGRDLIDEHEPAILERESKLLDEDRARADFIVDDRFAVRPR